MSENTAALQNPTSYDNCLISDCLKKLFTKAKGATAPGFIVRNHITELRAELEQLNVGQGLELSYHYLAAMELSMPADGFRYVYIHRNNVPVLFGYFQLFTISSKNFKFEKNKGFVRNLFRFFLRLKSLRVLISGNALRNETASFCFNAGALSKEEATELVVSAAEKIATDEGATALIIKDVPDALNISKWLLEIGYQAPWRDDVMEVSIDSNWASLDGYVAALSRKYKARAGKILSAGDGLSVRELTEDEITANEIAINSLFRNVSENQPFVLIRPQPDHFLQLKKVYQSQFELFGFFHKQEMVAFYCAFVNEDAYEVYYVGLNYDANAKYQLYFNILFAALERAIKLRKSQLKLGRTSFDAKASLGAKPVEMKYFIKIPSLPAVVVNWFKSYFSSMEDAKWKLRNPLKATARANSIEHDA